MKISNNYLSLFKNICKDFNKSIYALVTSYGVLYTPEVFNLGYEAKILFLAGSAFFQGLFVCFYYYESREFKKRLKERRGDIING